MKQHEKKKIQNIKRIMCLGIGVMIVILLTFGGTVAIHASSLESVSKQKAGALAYSAADMKQFQGVTVSPDATAWTTDYLDKTNEKLSYGYTIQTGEISSLRELQKGEHYYKKEAKGSIRIGQWKVAWPYARCIHDTPYYESFRGFPIKSNTICGEYYNNGWHAYCADCGEAIGELYFYGKSSTIKGITSMPAHSWYVYVCPHCQGLEQGSNYSHMCKAISYNFYDVIYDANTSSAAEGIIEGNMPSTRHMYNNADTYNGISADFLGYRNLFLRKNSYVCDGYKFVGWNTKADGSGTFLEDGASVWNLTDKEGGIVRLYAQWSKEKRNLFTRPLSLKETEFVFRAEDRTYYVKADGVTEHRLYAEAYVDGIVTADFQIDAVTLHIGENETLFPEWLKIIVPHGDISQNSSVFDNDSISFSESEALECYLHREKINAERSLHGIELSLEQGFRVDGAGIPFWIYPEAEAMLWGRNYYSLEENDRKNALRIIPDGTPPIISGLENFKDMDILDITEQTQSFTLQAVDAGSGLKEFTVCVSNQDNFMEERFNCDAEGRIILNIDKANPLYMGEIKVSAAAVDRVGNINVIGESGLTFTLETKLYKERNPEEEIFKTGEGAVLDITTMGFVERLEVIFPEELLQKSTNLQLIYDYEQPYLQNTETLKFWIPLGIQEQTYEITVKAYKNGEMLVSRQTLVVVEGNVLDELRTRIRNNG